MVPYDTTGGSGESVGEKFEMHVSARELTADVSCPKCGESTEIPVPDRKVELRVRSSVAAFGDYGDGTCSHGHRLYVYYC